MAKIICKQTHIVFKDGKIDVDNKENKDSQKYALEFLKKKHKIDAKPIIKKIKPHLTPPILGIMDGG